LYGTRLAEGGLPMAAIQVLLGHSSVTITEGHYAKYSPDSAGRQALRVLEGGKSGASGTKVANG